MHRVALISVFFKHMVPLLVISIPDSSSKRHVFTQQFLEYGFICLELCTRLLEVCPIR